MYISNRSFLPLPAGLSGAPKRIANSRASRFIAESTLIPGGRPLWSLQEHHHRDFRVNRYSSVYIYFCWLWFYPCMLHGCGVGSKLKRLRSSMLLDERGGILRDTGDPGEAQPLLGRTKPLARRAQDLCNAEKQKHGLTEQSYGPQDTETYIDR